MLLNDDTLRCLSHASTNCLASHNAIVTVSLAGLAEQGTTGNLNSGIATTAELRRVTDVPIALPGTPADNRQKGPRPGGTQLP